MVNDAEAATVRTMFQRFLRPSSMTKLTVALRSEGMRTKGGNRRGYSWTACCGGFRWDGGNSGRHFSAEANCAHQQKSTALRSRSLKHRPQH